MSISELMFLNLLEGKKGDTTEFSPIQLASLYTNSAFLVTVMDFLKDELWLQKQEDKKNGWPSPTVVDEGNLCIFKTN